ncbi:hypothetical protein V7124_19895 [Neobacillus niacini]|uniref:hypothetical protein n=1 Tax=Neobacillus niacini TaxID=86668 RepID=UPI002FFFCD4C
MREIDFKNYLVQSEQIQSKVKSVASKVSKALIVERELKVDLDLIVKNDEKMYKLLIRVQEELNDKVYHQVYQNAVRKYYLFVNGIQFPKMKDFEKECSRNKS